MRAASGPRTERVAGSDERGAVGVPDQDARGDGLGPKRARRPAGKACRNASSRGGQSAPQGAPGCRRDDAVLTGGGSLASSALGGDV